MMVKPSKSKLKEIFLLWAIANVNFCVKGHPSLPKDTILLAEDVKGVTAPSNGADGLKDLRVAQDLSQPIPDGTKLETAEALHHSQTGSRDTKMTPEVVGNAVTKDVEDGKGLKKDLKTAPKSEESRAVKSKGVPNPEPNVVDGKKKFLNVAQVQGLSDSDLIGYIAQKERELEKSKIEFLETTMDHKFEQKPFTEAGIQPSGAYFHNSVDSKDQYNQAYQKTLTEAKNLVSKESLTPEALSKLTNKEYVKKASLFDQKVQQNLAEWEAQEDLMHDYLSKFFKLQALEFKSQKKLDAKWTKAMEEVKEKAKETGEPTDPTSLEKAAQRQFIKNQAKRHPKNLGWKEDEETMKEFEKYVREAEKKALRSAKRVLPRTDLLRSAALKMKHLGKLFINFFKNMFAWFSKLGRKTSHK
ncbi:uncharacterized protein MELLADRAFT_124202 [Melampsora larici-populina 98AG31]|uniref:Secreted protein n=1 Tax=Melampsora larici-populina (strain 98AG31 / pathotype 3-4-7) TaxID=747676 RepID=F4S6E2_MELLP|nr:uncharacterized protein MELLADRAFT_124202 [Melampsora larici-populina 98AG31]EGF99810.1 secreted protein [Melampsora larici-populina 98AG31]